MNVKTPFQRVAEMNIAFGNPARKAGEPIDIERLISQCKNILDEYNELMVALHEYDGDIDKVRDALCDINVFSYGAMHLLGTNGDADMHAVLDGVMSRFIKDPMDKYATVEKHAVKGVTHVYFEGDYPTMVMKSAGDQPDAPKGKFLKSASYSEPVFDPLK